MLLTYAPQLAFRGCHDRKQASLHTKDGLLDTDLDPVRIETYRRSSTESQVLLFAFRKTLSRRDLRLEIGYRGKVNPLPPNVPSLVPGSPLSNLHKRQENDKNLERLVWGGGSRTLHQGRCPFPGLCRQRPFLSRTCSSTKGQRNLLCDVCPHRHAVKVWMGVAMPVWRSLEANGKRWTV